MAHTIQGVVEALSYGVPSKQGCAELNPLDTDVQPAVDRASSDNAFGQSQWPGEVCGGAKIVYCHEGIVVGKGTALQATWHRCVHRVREA